jgi:hypothetical protein
MKEKAAHLSLLGALLLSFAVSYFSDHIDPYYLRVIVTVGINITLAVSLNLVNGYTGQFSLGHAGFMCVGAYTSAVITMFVAPALLGQVFPPGHVNSWLIFPCAMLISGLTAAVSGLIVGIPSLRLKGDYLAIVTLGFGEIIRIIFLNIPAVGAARGLPGIPTYTNLFWAYAVAFITIYVVLAIVHSSYGRGFIAVHDDEIAAEAMGINTTKLQDHRFYRERVFRWNCRRFVRALQNIYFAERIRLHAVDRDRSDGDPGRNGQYDRCNRGCNPADRPAGGAAPGRRLSDGALFAASDRADADPAARFVSPEIQAPDQTGFRSERVMMGTGAILDVKRCTIRFGGLTAVSALDLTVIRTNWWD